MPSNILKRRVGKVGLPLKRLTSKSNNSDGGDNNHDNGGGSKQQHTASASDNKRRPPRSSSSKSTSTAQPAPAETSASRQQLQQQQAPSRASAQRASPSPPPPPPPLPNQAQQHLQKQSQQQAAPRSSRPVGKEDGGGSSLSQQQQQRQSSSETTSRPPIKPPSSLAGHRHQQQPQQQQQQRKEPEQQQQQPGAAIGRRLQQQQEQSTIAKKLSLNQSDSNNSSKLEDSVFSGLNSEDGVVKDDRREDDSPTTGSARMNYGGGAAASRLAKSRAGVEGSSNGGGGINASNRSRGSSSANSSEGSSGTGTGTAGVTPSSSLEPSLAKIRAAYGTSANIYADVLKVSRNATPSEIREAFFCLRYDIYQKLERPATGPNALTGDERRAVEDRMDAIAAAFHVLSDAGRRRAYDSSSVVLSSSSSASKAGRGGSVGSRGSSDSHGPGPPPPRSPLASSAPARLSPSKSDTKNADLDADGDSSPLPPDQYRRSVFRRRAARSRANLAVGGMNEPRLPVAKPVTGKINARPSPSESMDSIFSKDSNAMMMGGGSKGSDIGVEKKWTMGSADLASSGQGGGGSKGENPKARNDFEEDAKGSVGGEEGNGDDQNRLTPPNGNVGGKHNGDGWQQQTFDGNKEEQLPAGLDNLNAREQMLYRSQMYLKQQQMQQRTTVRPAAAPHPRANVSAGRLGSRYTVHDRQDKYASLQHGDAGSTNDPLASPTGVDGFDDDSSAMWGARDKKQFHVSKKETTRDGSGRGGSSGGAGGRRRAVSPEGDSANADQETASVASEMIATSKTQDEDDDDDDDDDTRTYDDDTRTQGDDTRTYDDTTRTYDDDTTTLGETVDDNTTVGESTWASMCEDDDATSYTTNNTGRTPPGNDSNGSGKYTPGHKKGKVPAPILKSSGGAVRRSASDNAGDAKRVTIHSHRGKGEDNIDDFSLFDTATCSVLPSFASLQEEVTGTYKDFTSALHQVSNAFVISPDDIDRMADKIRDAKIELGENYHRQVTDRKVLPQGRQKKK